MLFELLTARGKIFVKWDYYYQNHVTYGDAILITDITEPYPDTKYHTDVKIKREGEHYCCVKKTGKIL